jgi:hypothetical protein
MSKRWKQYQYIRKLSKIEKLKSDAEKYADEHNLPNVTAPKELDSEVVIDNSKTQIELCSILLTKANELDRLISTHGDVNLIANHIVDMRHILDQLYAKLKFNW